jgi:CRP-like cAMP-binding protein
MSELNLPDSTAYDLLRASRLADDLDEDECRVLAGAVRVCDFADGEVLVPEGESDEHLYVIVSGTIAKSKRDHATGGWTDIAVLIHGDFAGELGFVDGRPHYAALRAVGPTRTLSLDRQALEKLLVPHPQLVYKVMRSIFRVVHGILHRMGAEQKELTNYIYKQHGKY